jgi:hypothetical protein
MRLTRLKAGQKRFGFDAMEKRIRLQALVTIPLLQLLQIFLDSFLVLGTFLIVQRENPSLLSLKRAPTSGIVSVPNLCCSFGQAATRILGSIAKTLVASTSASLLAK